MKKTIFYLILSVIITGCSSDNLDTKSLYGLTKLSLSTLPKQISFLKETAPDDARDDGPTILYVFSLNEKEYHTVLKQAEKSHLYLLHNNDFELSFKNFKHKMNGFLFYGYFLKNDSKSVSVFLDKKNKLLLIEIMYDLS